MPMPAASPASRAYASMSAEMSVPSTSRPSASSGTSSLPVPHPRSSAGSPNRAMAARRYASSAASGRLTSAHQRAMSP